MKKLGAFIVLLVLLGIAVFVPQEIHESKIRYEERLVASVVVITNTLTSSPTFGSDFVNVALYAPYVTNSESESELLVTGMLGLTRPGETGQLDRFFAGIQNTCKGQIKSTCLRVNSLTVKKVRIVREGEVVNQVPAEAPMDRAYLGGVENLGRSGNNPLNNSAPNSATQREGQEKKQTAATKSEATVEKPKPVEKLHSAKLGTVTPPSVNADQARPAAKQETTNTQPPKTAPEKTDSSTLEKTTAKLDIPPPPPPPANPGAVSSELPSSSGDEGPATPEKETPSPPEANQSQSSQAANASTELAARFPRSPAAKATSQPKAVFPDEVLQIQIALQRLGYDPGTPDNVIGAKTTSAILAYQRNYGLPPTGKPSPDLLTHITTKLANVASDNGGETGARTQTSDGSKNTDYTVAQIQAALQRLGYDPGVIDNVVGQKTKEAILTYQRRNGLEPTGEASIELLNHIKALNAGLRSRQ